MASRDARAQVEHWKSVIGHGQETISRSLAVAAGALDAARQDAATQQWSLQGEAASVVWRQPARYAAWSDPVWDSWQPSPSLPEELRVGSINEVDAPATVPVLDGRTVVIATETEAAAGHARELLRSLAIRTAVELGRRVVLHLIDPHQGGYGFPERRHLSQDAPRTPDLAADLDAVLDAAAAFHQRFEGTAYAALTPDEQTRQPVHVVLALDFPRGYGYRGAQQLNEIARLAPAGVQLIVHHDLTADGTAGSASLDLVRPVVVEVDGRGQAHGPWGRLTAALDAAPDSDLVRRLGERFPIEPERGADAAPLPWHSLNPVDPTSWWQEDATREVRAVFGLDRDGRPLELAFGQDARGESRVHAVVAGATGAGKGVLLHSVILSLATRYRPDQLRFYLIDGQDGLEMQAYQNLPHAELVSVHTPVDLVRGVLVDLGAELDRRSARLVRAGVGSIAEYWTAGHRDMPRSIIMIDEYQALFVGDSTASTTGILQKIAAQGRRVGLHLLLVSQRFHALGLINQNALFNNIHTRISLKLTTDAKGAIGEFDRDGQELIWEHCTETGRVVMNSGGGQGPSQAGVVAYAPETERAAIVAALANRAAGARPPQVLNGDESPQIATNLALTALSRCGPAGGVAEWAAADRHRGGLALSAWHAYEHPFAFIAGRTFSSDGSAFAKVTRSADHNLMIIAPDPKVLTGIALVGLSSAAMSAPAGNLTVVVASEIPGPGSWEGQLSEGLTRLLAGRGSAVRSAGSPGDVTESIAEAVREIERRGTLAPTELAQQGPYLLVALGLERVPALRVVEGRYGSEPSEAGAKLQRVLKEGPSVGVHGIVGFTSRAAWAQVMPAKGRQRFVHRFYQQMSEDDSRELLDSSRGFRVMPPDGQGPQRAGYENRDSGEHYVFLPYTTDGDPLAAMAGFLRRANGGGR